MILMPQRADEVSVINTAERSGKMREARPLELGIRKMSQMLLTVCAGWPPASRGPQGMRRDPGKRLLRNLAKILEL